MMKLSDYVIQFIEELGVKHVFTLSGGGCIHLIDSLGKSDKIEYVCNLHEQGAAIAAEAYAQYTNNIGVALVTTGPGGLNALTGIAGAYLDSTPMLVIAGQVQTKDSKVCQKIGVRQLGFQEIDVRSVVKPITKHSVMLDKEWLVKDVLETAVHHAKSGRPGPVLVEIPLDIQAKEVNVDKFGVSPSHIPEAPLINIEKIVKKLNASKRPIILAGNGIRLSGAQGLFDNFIRRTKIPVLTTWKAADLLTEDDHLFVGRPGAIASRGANFNQQNADFILCLGARLDHGQLAYQAKNFAPNAYKVVCDVDVNELYKLRPYVDSEQVCDVSLLLRLLLGRIDDVKLNTSAWLKRCKETYRKYPVCNENYDRNFQPVNLYNFVAELSSQLAEGSLVVPGSSGACSEVMYQAFQVKKNTRMLNTPGLGSMGFGIPAAIGACLASGKRHTVCVEGDGGWMMNLQELEVVKRLNLPITFFVLNNDGYGSIRSTQNGFFGGKHVASSPESGVTLPRIDKIAKAFSIDSFSITTNSELEDGIRSALSFDDKPLICEVMVEKDHITQPRTISFRNKRGEFDTKPMQYMKPELSKEEQEENTI